MRSKQNLKKLIIQAERANILIILLTFTDVITTIIAKMRGFPEANKYVLILMKIFGFYLGLFIYFILIISASYNFLIYYRRYVQRSGLFYLLINTIGFCGLWGLTFSRFMPVLNNMSYILGFYIIPPSFLRLDLFLIIGIIYGICIFLNCARARCVGV